jgi:hypothetical protein
MEGIKYNYITISKKSTKTVSKKIFQKHPYFILISEFPRLSSLDRVFPINIKRAGSKTPPIDFNIYFDCHAAVQSGIFIIVLIF